jgi:hypothetical protein
MTTTDGNRNHEEVSTGPVPTADRQPTLLDHMGGPMGIAGSTVPVVVFVTAGAFLSLSMTIGVSVGVGLAFAGFRLLRGERYSSAFSGLLGVAAAAGLVAWTGSAKDFFVIGIWVSLGGFVINAGSVLARRPLTGLAWNLLHGGTHDWRSDRTVLRAHDTATLATAAVLGARFAVQQWLYDNDATGWLAVAKIVMGTPLTVLTALVVLWAFRRSTKRLVTPA